MSIQELMTKYMKEQENMATMSFEETTLRDDEKLEKFQTVENDA